MGESLLILSDATDFLNFLTLRTFFTFFDLRVNTESDKCLLTANDSHFGFGGVFTSELKLGKDLNSLVGTLTLERDLFLKGFKSSEVAVSRESLILTVCCTF